MGLFVFAGAGKHDRWRLESGPGWLIVCSASSFCSALFLSVLLRRAALLGVFKALDTQTCFGFFFKHGLTDSEVEFLLNVTLVYKVNKLRPKAFVLTPSTTTTSRSLIGAAAGAPGIAPQQSAGVHKRPSSRPCR